MHGMQVTGISIHAPTKGATSPVTIIDPETEISIHAPTKGATIVSYFHKKYNKFQSTLPRRERLYRLLHMRSIWTFQSTLPRRERQPFKSGRAGNSRFQSTLPRRERLFTGQQPAAAAGNFNPRSHEGSDGYLYQPGNVPLISIHAPTKGATYKNVRSELQSSISIHAPTKGATSFRASLKGTEWISIHAPTKGATTAELFSP